MRKALSVLLIVFVNITIVFSNFAYASDKDAKKWTIGYEENTNGPSAGEQGVNGWYFLYSDEMNTDGAMDTSKLKECVWTNRGSCWIYYGHSSLWVTEEMASEEFDFQEEGCWWLMDDNGIMSPNCGTGLSRSVVAWEVPQSGTYSVNLEYTGGSDSYEWEGKTYYQKDADGITLSMNTETDILDKVKLKKVTKKKPDLTEGKMTVQELELKKGDRLYVSVDPGKNGAGDSAEIKMTVEQIRAASIFEDIGANVVVSSVCVLAILVGFMSVIIREKRESMK